MHKVQNGRTTELCHDTLFRAPALFLAHLKSFFSESHSPYAKYGSFAILKNNIPTALKCAILDSKYGVYNLCISSDKLLAGCAQTVLNFGFIRRAKILAQTCAHVLHTLYHQVILRIFSELTSLKDQLYTLSTQPIITIYLYKGDYIL